MTFPMTCPACHAPICCFEVGEPPSVVAVTSHFRDDHGLSPLLAASVAQSLVFNVYGLVSDDELEEIMSVVRVVA